MRSVQDPTGSAIMTSGRVEDSRSLIVLTNSSSRQQKQPPVISATFSRPLLAWRADAVSINPCPWSFVMRAVLIPDFSKSLVISPIRVVLPAPKKPPMRRNRFSILSSGRKLSKCRNRTCHVPPPPVSN